MDNKTFAREKRKLREVYKLYKAGMIKESDIPPRIKSLLMRYYGVRFSYHAVRGK